MKYIISLLLIGLSFMGMAQRPVRKDYSFSTGVDLAYATGRFNYAHSLGYGLTLQGEYLFADNSALTFNTGYMYFPAKKFAASDSIDASLPTEQLNNFGMVPLLFGMKIDNEGKFYVHPQFGFALRSKPFVSATYALAVGMVASTHSDISVRFQAVQKKGIVASFFSVRAAYTF